VSGQFTVSNELCPVTTQTITTGGSDFSLTEATDSDGFATFTVVMDSGANAVEATHSYTITAVADGSAQSTVTGDMDIAQVCLASLESSFDSAKTFSYAVPESTTATPSFPSATTEYVSEPPSSSAYLPFGYSCSQSFSMNVDTTDGAAALSQPSELSMTSGIFALSNVASKK
jgi:hypothetical protein